MKSFSFRPAAAGFLSLLALLGAQSAQAGFVSFVSSKGVDSGNCASPASPCRTFQYALGQTNGFGEIKTLDPGNYSPVLINKSVTISGVPGAGITRTTAGNAIAINAGASAIVNLRGLEINGLGLATNGIRLERGVTLNIADCVIRRIAADGISVVPGSGLTTVTITDTISSNNGNFGIQFVPSGSGQVRASLSHVITNNNGFSGVLASPGSTVTIVDSEASFNVSDGFRASGTDTTTMRIGRSSATGNDIGVNNVSNAAVLRSYGDNKITGNTSAEVSGTFTVIPMR